jgi:thymidylate synthase
MKQYLDLLRAVRETGVRQQNRTGIDTFMVPGATLRFDLRDGFPIVTTKQVNFRAVAAELCGFIRGYDSAADFRALGTKIWDQNANENKAWLANPNRRGTDDLGRIYGVQWRRWQAYPGFHVDQLARVVQTILRDPESRRIVMMAWNPGELNQMALPPCPLLCQFLVEQEGGVMHMTMYQRSCDLFLGVPFNISSYSLLLELVATVTGHTPGTLTMFLADAHIYENHVDQVDEQLKREPKALPHLIVNVERLDQLQPIEWLEALHPTDIALFGYEPHPAIKAPMAV